MAGTDGGKDKDSKDTQVSGKCAWSRSLASHMQRARGLIVARGAASMRWFLSPKAIQQTMGINHFVQELFPWFGHSSFLQIPQCASAESLKSKHQEVEIKGESTAKLVANVKTIMEAVSVREAGRNAVICLARIRKPSKHSGPCRARQHLSATYQSKPQLLAHSPMLERQFSISLTQVQRSSLETFALARQ